MCGILGGWVNRPLPSGIIEQALERIHHRGPDSFGVWQQGKMFLGMRRLAIIDLETGQQPIYNENKDVVVVCNGEIYNYRELRTEIASRGHEFRTQTDVEPAVHLFEEKGIECVNQLRGMFGMAIADTRKGVIHLARDRFGKKPLYYYFAKDLGLLFASEIKGLRALVEACGHGLTICDNAVYDYLSLGVVPQPRSIYREIQVLPSGSTLTFDGAEPVVKSFWSRESVNSFPGNYEDAQEEVRRLVRESVKIRLRSDVPLGVFLSGGVDSSVVAYEAAEMLGGDLDSFTVKTSNEALDESGVALRTANALGIRNEILDVDVNPIELVEKVVAHYDQPFADPSAMPSLAISKAARHHVKVVLNGDGGDELFAGYRRCLAAKRMKSLDVIPGFIWRCAEKGVSTLPGGRRSKIGFVKRVVSGLGQTWGSRYLRWTTDMMRDEDKIRFASRYSGRSTESWIDENFPEGPDPVRNLLKTDGGVNLLSALLVKMDMATMAYSLEARSPLMDHVLGEFCATLPTEMLVRGRKCKAVLRDAYVGRVPGEVIEGKKRGFEIPLIEWLKGPLRTMVYDQVGAADSEVQRYFDRRFVLDVIEGRSLQDRNWGYVVYSLLILELWLRQQRSSNL